MCYNQGMNDHPAARLLVYVLFALLVISSVILAMPGAFSPNKESHTTDMEGHPLPPNQHRFRLNQTISIRGIPFTFTKVDSDNRCPENEQCVTRGHAVLIMHINTSSTEEDITLDTNMATLYAPFSISVISLTPTPTKGDQNTEAVIEIDDTSSDNQ